MLLIQYIFTRISGSTNYYKRDETIRGHVFCSFLALLLRHELEEHLARREWKLEWADLVRDLDNLVEMELEIDGKGYVFRGQTAGVAGKVFQACGVALPPVMRPC
jgi:transposase